MDTSPEAFDSPGRNGMRRRLPPLYHATVLNSYDVRPRMRRIVLALKGEAAFAYSPGQAVVLMLPLSDGSVERRDYTIRSAMGDTITIDIFKHGDTPGPRWAASVVPGDVVELRGPRGNLVFDQQADWHLMSGDETCIPAIAHMLEQAPADGSVFAFIEVATEEDRVDLPTKADLRATWLYRGASTQAPTDLLPQAISGFSMPEGTGKAYIIGETGTVRRQRHDLIAKGMIRKDILSEGYWRPGRIGGHDHVDD